MIEFALILKLHVMDVAHLVINLIGGVVLNTKLPRRRRKKTANARAVAKAVARAVVKVVVKAVARAAAKAVVNAVKRVRRMAIPKTIVWRRIILMCDAISASNGAT